MELRHSTGLHVENVHASGNANLHLGDNNYFITPDSSQKSSDQNCTDIVTSLRYSEINSRRHEIIDV